MMYKNKTRKSKFLLLGLMIITLGQVSYTQDKMPVPMEQCIDEPVIYTGFLQPDKYFTDGRLPHAAGAHHFQVFRANRSEPVGNNNIGWTYNHQPYLTYWNGF